VKLAVFDLDGTLTHTNAVDDECFVHAFLETLQLTDLNRNWNGYEHVTDEGVTRQIFIEQFGRYPAPEETGRIVDRFLDRLIASHAADASKFVEIRGASSLVQRLRDSGWAVALATGAWRRSAEFKIQRAGLQIQDIPAAFAEDGPSREGIVRAAIERAGVLHRQSEFERIISVGDAIWDVKTARNLSLAFLGIASGARAALLRDNGASHVIEDYRDPERCLQYLDEAQIP